MSVRIICFGGDSVCENLNELVEKLSGAYSGKYISIVTTQESGLDKATQVTVDDSGGITYSHSGKVINPEVFF